MPFIGNRRKRRPSPLDLVSSGASIPANPLQARRAVLTPARLIRLYFLPSASTATAIVSYADPRQGTILSPDNDGTQVDPRQGTILSPDNDGTQVDPRQGTILK